jgi:hypothetical protein
MPTIGPTRILNEIHPTRSTHPPQSRRHRQGLRHSQKLRGRRGEQMPGPLPFPGAVHLSLVRPAAWHRSGSEARGTRVRSVERPTGPSGSFRARTSGAIQFVSPAGDAAAGFVAGTGSGCAGFVRATGSRGMRFVSGRRCGSRRVLSGAKRAGRWIVRGEKRARGLGWGARFVIRVVKEPGTGSNGRRIYNRGKRPGRLQGGEKRYEDRPCLCRSSVSGHRSSPVHPNAKGTSLG